MCFREWLYQQQDRADAIGGLARQLTSDCISPLWSNRQITYHSYLIFRNADKAMFDALVAAFVEWHKLSHTQEGRG